MSLSIISEKAGQVSSNPPGDQTIISTSMVATHTPQDAPPLDLLMVPGGIGSDRVVHGSV